MNIHSVIFILLFIDSIGAFLVSWFSPNWYQNTMGGLARILPPSKVWSVVYLLLVLYIGYLIGIY